MREKHVHTVRTRSAHLKTKGFGTNHRVRRLKGWPSISQDIQQSLKGVLRLFLEVPIVAEVWTGLRPTRRRFRLL